MKAISLWQPWASALALGSKRNETRGWATSYRGPLAIHAAKRKHLLELRGLVGSPQWWGALYGDSRIDEVIEQLPFGAVVAVVDLVDCIPVEEILPGTIDQPMSMTHVDTEFQWTERQMGDFSPGRFAWLLCNLRALKKPVPFLGRQGFFNVPDSLLV